MFSIGACYSKARDQYYSLLVNNCNLHLSLHSLTVPQILNQFQVFVQFTKAKMLNQLAEVWPGRQHLK